MLVIFTRLIPLLISYFILMLSYGLIGLLIPVKLNMVGTNTDTIGLILSMYAVGLLIGGFYSRHLISKVGHVRVFAVCAAIGAASILICSLTLNYWVWATMRMLMGLSIACAFTVMDGWLSQAVSEAYRGRILAVSQSVILAAFFLGQFLLGLASPATTSLFIIAAILLCLSMIPLATSRKPEPLIEHSGRMQLTEVAKISPLGVASCLFGGILYGALISMLPIFAEQYGINEFRLSLYMASAVLGAFVLQFPVGMLSDRFQRRTILIYLLAIAIITSASTPFLAKSSQFIAIMFTTGISAGIFTCLYPIGLAEALDRVKQSDSVATMGALLSIYAIGNILGPLVSSITMKHFGNDVLFYFLAIAEFSLLLFLTYRIQVRAPVPLEDQESFVMHPSALGAPLVNLDPRIQSETSIPDFDGEQAKKKQLKSEQTKGQL